MAAEEELGRSFHRGTAETAHGPLRQQFRRNGEWLFRKRSYLPVVALAVVALVTYTSLSYPRGSHSLDLGWEIFCVLVSTIGLAVRVLTIGFVPRGTSGRVRRLTAMSLNTTGMYSIVRHPLYLGNAFMWLGVALFPRIWWLAVLISLAFWLYYERIIFAEEEYLCEIFGDEYLKWAHRTPAFIPRTTGWVRPDLPFRGIAVLGREYGGWFGLVLAFSLLEVAGDHRALGRWTLDPFWLWILIVSVTAYTILHVLKKRSLLDVPGR